MPTSYVKKLAKKHGMSISTAERRWDAAKEQAKKQGHDEEFDYITGIFKRMMGEGEETMEEYNFTVKDAETAKDIIRRAREALGQDLEGGSLTDLLLDNMPKLRDTKHARALLKQIGESVMTTEEEEESKKKYKENVIARQRQMRKIYNDLTEKGKGKKEFISHLVDELGMSKEQADFWWFDMTGKMESAELPAKPTFKEFLVIEEALRYHKSLKLGSGLRVNVAKSGLSLSFGGKGARFNLRGDGGYTSTIGAPSTGFSWRKFHKRKKPAAFKRK